MCRWIALMATRECDVTARACAACRLSPAVFNNAEHVLDVDELDYRLATYTAVFSALALHDDWRHLLGSLIQPLPFPEE